MSNAKQHLIYFADNQSVAKEIYADLRGRGFTIEQHAISENDTAGQLASLSISNIEAPVILLVTDNFLKSANCMFQAMSQIKTWANSGWLMPVVANGFTRDENGQAVEVHTAFERVSNIIQYMNYWQDKYLEYRKLKRTQPDYKDLDAKIASAKEISSDMGELLRFMRSLEHFSTAEFKANDYAVLRIANGEKITIPASNSTEENELGQEPNLVDIIKGSSEELIAENPKTKEPAAVEEEIKEEEISDELLAEIPGISMLEETQAPSESTPEPIEDFALDAEAASLMDELMMSTEEVIPSESSIHDEDEEEEIMTGLALADDSSDDQELNSILDEVLAEEGLGDDDEKFEFLPEDSDNPNDFNLDALLEDEEYVAPQNTPEPEVADDEVMLDLLTDEEGLIVTDEEKISPEEILEHALDLFTDGETEEGLSHLKTTVEANPTNTTLRYYYAYSLARYAKDPEGARFHLETLLKQDTQHPEAWYLMGELAENQDDFEGARKCFETAVRINPDYPDIHYRLGLLTVQYFLGEEEKAANYFRKAITQNEENVDAQYALANLLSEQLDEPEKAAKHFAKVLAIEPEHEYANYDMAMLHFKLEDHKNAANFYQKAIAINPALKTEKNDAAFGFVFQNEEVAVAGNGESTDAILTSTKENGQAIITEEIAEPAPEPAPPGPIVLITGGTAGIGRATAEVFAKNGYRVIITGRREERLEEISNQIAEHYPTDIQSLSFDVRDAAATKAALESLPEAWQEIDILINNAGLSRGLAPIHEGELEDWDTMIDTNIKGLLYLTRAIAPHMVARKHGHIINVASSAGKEVYPGGNVYCATKSAVEALTKAMRLDLYKHNVRVSQVAPGHVEETEFARVRFDWDEEKAAKTYDNFQPLKASDVAEVIYFMATRPAHVNIQDVFMFGTQQAGSNFIDRSGR